MTTAINGNTATAAASALSSATGATPSLGKDDFLKLLVSQMQNQDPLNPSDPTQFTAELAQFSSLEQLTNINGSLSNMASSQQMSPLSMIGKEVVASGNTFHFDSQSVDLGYQLDSSADQVQLLVQDGMGRTVATIPGKDLTAGQHFLTWDGKDSNGNVVPPGDYSLMVGATQGKDTSVDATALIKGVVNGVDFDSSGSTLETSVGTVKTTDVKSVRNS